MSLLTFFSSIILSFLVPWKLKWRPQHFYLTGSTVSEAVLPLLLFPCLVLCTQASQNQYFQQASILHAVLNSAVVKYPGNNHHTWGKIPSDAMQNKSYLQNCQVFMEIDLCLLLQHSKKSLLALLGWHLWNLQNLKSTKEQPGRCR